MYVSKGTTVKSNSEFPNVVEGGKWGVGVSPASESAKTLTGVKVPKC
jgi:hypothetical protein